MGNNGSVRLRRLISIILLSSMALTISSCKSTASGNSNENDTSISDSVMSDGSSTTEESGANGNSSQTSGEASDIQVIKPNGEQEELNQLQKNSVAMLNYMTMVSQKIENSKSSRIFLEKVYTELINNTGPDKIDKTTQYNLSNMLDIIEDYRMLDIKRERLRYIYDQDKANTIKQAIPNPLSIMSVVQSIGSQPVADPKVIMAKLAVSVAYTAVDSITKYANANDALDKQFMLDGWSLDDEEAKNIHKNRKRAFNYMIDIVRNYELPGNLALSEEDIQSFVEYADSDNVHKKMQFFESNKDKYRFFSSYWIELADCYYETEQYSKCIECVDTYESVYAGIFRKDYEYSQFLPKAIVALKNVTSGDEYRKKAEKYAQAMVDNSGEDDWSLRYFAAQTYIDLYAQYKDEAYIKKAYDITLNNVNSLTKKQIELNDKYLNEVEDCKLGDMPDTADDNEKSKYESQKKELDEYNKSMREKRKTECPPLYDPLSLNCELLFSLADKINVGESEKSKIDGILKNEGESIFLTKPISDKFSFTQSDKQDYDASLSKDELALPADILCEGATVTAIIENGDDKKEFNDWKVFKVDRSDNGIDSFKAYLYSDEIKKHTWSKDETVRIIVSYGISELTTELSFKVSDYSKGLLFFPDSVTFEKI